MKSPTMQVKAKASTSKKTRRRMFEAALPWSSIFCQCRRLEDTVPGEIFGKYFLFESIKRGDWKKDIVKITSIAFVCLGSVSTHEAIR